MIPVMKAIEYNMWMSLMRWLGIQIPAIGGEYGLTGTSITVLPSYPHDLTKFKKPSIIVQKVHTTHRGIGMGNVAGMYQDDTGIYDVSGTVYNTTYQINADARNNTECSLITSMICEGIIDRLTPDKPIDLMDFTADIMNPLLIGRMDTDHDLDLTPLSVDDDRDYICAIRCEFTTIRTLVDTDQDMVDLSKPIKWNKIIMI